MIPCLFIPPLFLYVLSSHTSSLLYHHYYYPFKPSSIPFHPSKFDITLSLYPSIPPSESIPRAVVGLMHAAGGQEGYEDKLVALFINKTTEIDRYKLDYT
jgi:hypothetical protein